MLTKDEKDFLNKIPADKKVGIYPFNKKINCVVEIIINSIKNIYPKLEVKHMGASALGISGQNDLDIYALSDPKNFEKYLPGLIKILGNPLHRHKQFIEWNFKKNGFEVQFYLSNPNTKKMKDQIKVYEILKNNKGLQKEYEELKQSLDGKSLREYQEKKYEFYHRILNNNI